MQPYRKKPVVIYAVQFTGENASEIISSVGNLQDVDTMYESDTMNPILVMRTLEGTMTARKGDWIIKGVKGEFYPCKPDIFEATYEPATEELPA